MFAKILVLAGLAAALGTPDPFVGRWKMNPAKSSYLKGAPPRKQMATITVTGSDLRVQVDGITPQGTKTVVRYTVPYEGGTGKMDLKSSPAYDGVTGRHLGLREREISRWKNGKSVFTALSTVSSDGETMTVHSFGISPVGKPVDAFVIYDRLK